MVGLENGHHMLSEGAVVGMDKFSSDNNYSVFLAFKCHPTADISDILYGVISSWSGWELHDLIQGSFSIRTHFCAEFHLSILPSSHGW